jgi:hypothetical protein
MGEDTYVMRAHLQSYSFVLVGLALCASADAAAAQARLSVADVREIVDGALEAVLPPDRRLSGLSVAQRTIFFDHAATLAAFGHDRRSRAGLSALQLQRPVEDASPDLMEDCSGFGPAPCARLGQGVYVSVVPPRQTSSGTVVWVHVLWSSRTESHSPDERVIRVGFSSEVFFTRTPSGQWEYVRTGTTIAY